MNITDIMERIHAMPQTTEEWVATAADISGVIITTLWITGTHQLFDGMLHSTIAVVTLISVSFSLITKIYAFRKQKKQEHERKTK